MQKVAIIIPAHNEEKRIGNTIKQYGTFFSDLKRKELCATELIIVLNGCTDNTAQIVQQIAQQCPDIAINLVDIPQAGKGLAIIAGFKYALMQTTDLIGFVDADMATSPQSFYELLQQHKDFAGVIASRYMPGAQVIPPRPKIKRYGSKLFYEPIIRFLFGIRYYDYQCGAKLFTSAVLQKIVPQLTVRQWAFDVELLYLCKKYGFAIKEIPTIWYDQQDSKLKMMRAGLQMISSLITIRLRHLFKQ